MTVYIVTENQWHEYENIIGVYTTMAKAECMIANEIAALKRELHFTRAVNDDGGATWASGVLQMDFTIYPKEVE